MCITVAVLATCMRFSISEGEHMPGLQQSVRFGPSPHDHSTVSIFFVDSSKQQEEQQFKFVRVEHMSS